MSEFPPSYPPPPTQPKLSTSAPRDYTTLSLHKVALIAGLAIATLLPNWFISGLIAERETRHGGVKQEFARNWGPEQSLYTPTLLVPFQPTGDRLRQFVKITPMRLDLAATITPQERKRGLFVATVYDAKVDMQGTFVVPPEARLREFVSEKDGRFLWEESMIALGTATSLTGLRATDNIAIDGRETPWQSCLEATRQDYLCRSVSVVLAQAPLAPAAAGNRTAFKASVSLRGTGAFAAQFAGKELNAIFRSPWPSPSFSGNTLPLSSTVTDEGFEANWQTTEFGSPRILASSNLLDTAMWKGPTVGVDLIEATPIYRMINRVAKYGLLFVVLAFATYLFFELLSRLQIHIVQYGLLGLSLSLFSLLLLSLSEPIGYTTGYLVSAGLVLSQSTLYTAAVARRFKPALLFAAMLASLFAFIYVLLGLETYSLLIGALALFVVVSALMVLTQMINLPGRLSGAPA